MRLIKNSRYLPGDKLMELQRRTQPQKSSVSFAQMTSSEIASELKEYRIISIKAFRNIDTEEKLYIAYRCEYSLS